jgi:hypothetical protein
MIVRKPTCASRYDTVTGCLLMAPVELWTRLISGWRAAARRQGLPRPGQYRAIRQGEAAPVRHPPVRHPKVYRATCFCLVELENWSQVRAREGEQAGLKPSRIDWKE